MKDFISIKELTPNILHSLVKKILVNMTVVSILNIAL
ncbi:DUF4368 domain-containing protein [Alkalihalobacillus deserti]